ncbi:MFS transporter, SP family, general alpha glucoside:H+ symporter, partial [Kwoniella heveanensis BCC8398]
MDANDDKRIIDTYASGDISKDVKDLEQPVVHLEHAGDATGKQWDQLRQDAIAAEELEQSMNLREALRVYPQAAFWSFAISLCIVMEGYDIGLLGSIIGLPTYRERYGRWSETAGSYQLSPTWQTAIGQASTIGCFVGIFACSWAQDRWGYRRTIQVALVALTCFIFIVFFAPNVQVLFVGQMLCGLPWGAFASVTVSYASDVTPVPLRGYLTTYVNLCWVIGQFIAAGVLQSTSTRTDQWGYRSMVPCPKRETGGGTTSCGEAVQERRRHRPCSNRGDDDSYESTRNGNPTQYELSRLLQRLRPSKNRNRVLGMGRADLVWQQLRQLPYLLLPASRTQYGKLLQVGPWHYRTGIRRYLRFLDHSYIFWSSNNLSIRFGGAHSSPLRHWRSLFPSRDQRQCRLGASCGYPHLGARVRLHRW